MVASSQYKKKLRKSLGQFIRTRNILPLILAVFLGTALEKFFYSVSVGFVVPIVIPILQFFIKGINKENSPQIESLTFKFLGITFYVGPILARLISLQMSILFVYLFIHFFVLCYLNR